MILRHLCWRKTRWALCWSTSENIQSRHVYISNSSREHNC